MSSSWEIRARFFAGPVKVVSAHAFVQKPSSNSSRSIALTDRKNAIVGLSTLHPRHDARILSKQARSLAASFPNGVYVMLADGKGNAPGGPHEVSILDLGALPRGRLGRALVGPWRALSAIRALRPAIVHFHDPELIPLGMVLKILGYTVIYDVHEDVPSQILTKHWLHPAIRAAVARLMSVAEWLSGIVFDAIVPATPKIAERFPVSKTVAVQNYPVAAELRPAIETPYARRPPHFAYPGVLAPERGIVELVQAVELLGDLPDVRLQLAGTFSPAGFADTLRARPGWTSVSYHGELSRSGVAGLLGRVRAGLVVHHPIPNEVDAQPIKIYEYLAAGLPVIASDFRPLRRLIDEVGCGLLVEPRNPDALATAMRWILEHPAEAEAMGARGREAVARSYGWDVEARKLIDLYRRLLKATPA